MLTIEKYVTSSPAQMEMIIEGMRNPLNSWAQMDSFHTHIEDPETLEIADYCFHLGEKDEYLMCRLARLGSSHAKYRRMMTVLVTLSAPLYWWKEFDTYKVGTVANSCSTMHKIAEKPFTMEDFSCEHLGYYDPETELKDGTAIGIEGMEAYPMDILTDVIACLNHNREMYLNSKHEYATGETSYDKRYWWQMIQLLPSSYNQKRTVLLNYEVLSHIYKDRKNHKLDEWHTFFDWIKTLPYIDIVCPIVGFSNDTDHEVNISVKEENTSEQPEKR